MDRDEIIRRLEKIAGHAVHTVGEPLLVLSLDDGIALYEAAALLKEQEPKQVVITTISSGTKYFHCPRCNHDLCVYPRQKYCSNCGQNLKYE